MSSQFISPKTEHQIIVALGSNKTGPWGEPYACLVQALGKLDCFPISLLKVSSFYETRPIGATQQNFYINSAAILKTSLAPESLLRKIKQIEREAGRRARGRTWGARSLDIDIIDYKGAIRNWDLGRKKPGALILGGLILPHAHVHLRPFVLEPVAEIAPDWRHPVLRLAIQDMLRMIPEKPHAEGMIIRKIKAF